MGGVDLSIWTILFTALGVVIACVGAAIVLSNWGAEDQLRRQSGWVFFAAGLALAASTSVAHADDWKSKYKELTFAVVPAENASGVSDRYAPFVDYLSKELGVPVKLRIANLRGSNGPHNRRVTRMSKRIPVTTA